LVYLFRDGSKEIGGGALLPQNIHRRLEK